MSCICGDGKRCHLHALEKAYCIGCGWRVWIDVDHPPLLVLCRECS